MPYLLGLDISTTSAKALLVREDGSESFVQHIEQPISQPYPLWSEQNPQDWWQGIALAIRSVIQSSGINPADIQAIGLTGQMHGLVMLDQAGDVLRPAILWNDQRTQAECDEIVERVGFERLIALTGNQALTGFTAPKILWVRNHEPDIYARCKQVLLPKDYIRYRLTGEYATDLAGAAGTLLLDVAKRKWSTEVLQALDIPLAWMPPTHEGPEITGVISALAAAETGLIAGTPVVGGGGDQAAGAVGMGCVTPESIGVTVGTSGVVFAPLNHYAFEPQGRLHAFCHAAPDMWHFMGVILSAAGSLRWYRDTFAAGLDFTTLLEESQSVPAASDGLFFLPYLTGERTPHPDPLARAAFIGLTPRHTRAYLTRSILEGVAFGLKDAFTLIDQTGLPDNFTVRISGGGAKSPLWKQIISDVLNAPLVEVNTTEGGAFGAALLASVAAGYYSDIQEACGHCIQVTSHTEPSSNVAAYAHSYAVYQDLYPALKPIFPKL